jgi:predicted nucleic acid-binding Zn finger protein
MDSRETNGKQLFDDGLVISNTDGTFSIRGKNYNVSETSCNCPDRAIRRQGSCKHMIAVKYWIKTNIVIPVVDEKQFKELLEYIEGMGGVVPSNKLYDNFTDTIIELAVQQKKILQSGQSFIII